MQNNNLTRFDEGGTHQQNPLGGIPQGQDAQGNMNTVEQGETKSGNFVYSDRITLDSNRIKQFNLPAYAANKSVSAASKAIEDKFKDRQDKYANETKKTLLDRLANAQESLKAEQAQTQQAMQANSQQAPEDMMSGQVPEGMEEFVQPEQSEPMAAYGGMQNKYLKGGEIDPATGLRIPMQALDPMQTAGMVRMPSAMPSAPLVPDSAGKQPTTSTSTGEGVSAAGMIGAAGAALQLGQTAFGKAAQDVSGAQASDRVSGVGMIGGSAVKGAAAGAAFGPLGAGIGAAVGGLAGIAGLGKARKAETLNNNRFAVSTSNALFDNYAAYGGNLNITKYAEGGIIDGNKNKDVRKAGQSLVVNPITELNHTNKRVIPTNMGKLNYFKTDDAEYNSARKDFVNWYADPATTSKFAKNTGYDPARLYDMTSKATSMPAYKGTAYKQPPIGAKAIFNTLDTSDKEEIIYHRGIGSGPIQHELTHAGAMGNILGPSLVRVLGSPRNQKLPTDVNDPNYKNTFNSVKDYLSIPEEAYGNFHEFRVNLGLKPGENIDVETLKRKVKEKNLEGENFYSTFADDKIVDAINKIAYNGNNNSNANMAAYGGNLNVSKYAEGGPITGYGSDGKWIKPIAGEADYNTNVIQNVHNAIGITSDTPGYGKLLGNKSSIAYNNWLKTNDPDSYISPSDKLDVEDVFYGKKTSPSKSAEYFKSYMTNPTAGTYVKGLQSKLGLNSKGYKFNPETPTLPERKNTEVVPTQTKAGFEAYANAAEQAKKDATPLTGKQKLNNALKYVGENAGEALRYAPIAANLLQMKNLKKPTGVQYQTLGNRYKPSYVDEATGRNIVDAEGNNTIAAISQSGASQGATRNAILGAGLNKTRALSDVYANASAQNRAEDARAQEFNVNIDQSNVSTANRGIDEMRMDDAAYRGAKSKMIANLGTSAGAIGKEIADSQLASALTGYTRKGKYLYKADGTKVTPEEMVKIKSNTQSAPPTFKKGDKYTDENGKVQTFKYGGYLNTKK